MNFTSDFVADNHSHSGKLSHHSVSLSSQPSPTFQQRGQESTRTVNSHNKCSICLVTFANPASFQMHMEQTHQKPMPYVCSLCGKCYASYQGLQFHIQAHSGKVHVCPVCDSKFSQNSTMRRHMRLVHSSNQCAKCKGVFKLSHDYNQHVISCYPLGFDLQF